MSNNVKLFDDWASDYDKHIDDIGGPLTNYRVSIKKAFRNYPIGAENVLDIGVGTGNFLAEYVDHSKNLYGIDISSNMLEETKHKIPSINISVGSFNEIPYESNYFDLIISSFCFHEVSLSERAVAFKEVNRVLKTNGKFNFLDIGFKNTSEMEDAKSKYIEQWDYTERYHFEKEIRKYANEADLVIEKIDYLSDLHINVILRKR